MRIKALLLALALAASLGLGMVATAAPAHADPCFFGAQEFDNWFAGARWGDSLTHVENSYANCGGVWENQSSPFDGGLYAGSWNGHNERVRVWPRSDGGQTKITFAHYDSAPTWRAHDEAETGNLNVLGGTQRRHECEWPRPDGNPCSES